MKPLAIDLFCGLGGWTHGLLAEGWEVVGFDIERHDYGDGQHYPAQLVLQDVLTIHGKQFKDASLIVASPPCQEYSYMAMPWSRAKSLQAHYRTGKRDTKKLTALFNACFRIQREAIQAAGHFIPIVVENVRGAQPWVGKARWNFGSYYLWGDVPALMPIALLGPMNLGVTHRPEGHTNFHHWSKNDEAGHKNARNWWSDGAGNLSATTSSKSKSRKAASAAIAKIPLPLARWIAKVYKPKNHCPTMNQDVTRMD